jgi:amino acid adenylation domain-containing protein
MRLEELVSNSARRTPGAVAAISSAGQTITYAGLDDHSDRVSAALRALNVQAGDRVGLCLRKTINALGAVFGVLKAGAAYVPVDYSAPAERNGYIFSNCAAMAIIVERTVADELQAKLEGGPWAMHEFPMAGEEPVDFVVLARDRAPEDQSGLVEGLAYILYTSGSTGQPKGVMHSHKTALAFVDWVSDEFQPVASDRFSSHAPFHFDLSILDIYVPLKHGASVVLINSETGKQPARLPELIEKHRITIWYSTPSILRLIVDFGKPETRDCSSLRIVNFAGEVFPTKHLRGLMGIWPKPVYYNLYGPTETNVCTFFKVPSQIPDDADYVLPIGKACSGDTLLVAEPDNTPVSPGSQGELLVSGSSVMLNYWKLPEHNSAAFTDVDGIKWYRTGDIVMELASGDIKFVGRRDRMVKRRGFRVELGEIEAALHKHPSIPEAAVLAADMGEAGLEIRAYYVWSDEAPPSLLKLKKFCSQNLPYYMAPDKFVCLPELPKTSTDKVDYQRLKEIA